MVNIKCAICNKAYKICNSCWAQRTFQSWRGITDTMEHYKIYFAIHGYTISNDREAAKKELQQCDLSDMENFKPEIKSVIKEIMADPNK